MSIQGHLKPYCPTVMQFVQTHQSKLSKINKIFIVFVIVGAALVLISLAVTSPIFVTVISGITIVGVIALVISALLLWLGKEPKLLSEPGSESITIQNLHSTERQET
ncbi:hypothetical protein C834K_0994 [Chlamydia poikilotherma]|uniref:Uncharacterized protein n=1 Tax=Chlamydia poikilotherma TaxID=1967783 RepID=A0A3B0Q1N1_9CHLA|nr:hypothetical protein [Chlamydia poikilotherma]SYX09425.1 hypothetical protein C834K_0994 [Chlamydia poikilotherma]